MYVGYRGNSSAGINLTRMVHIYLSYFTPEVIDEIRSSPLYFKEETWKLYREYHNRYDQISSKNAIYIMNEFRNVCRTIECLPKASLTYGNLRRIFHRD